MKLTLEQQCTYPISKIVVHSGSTNAITIANSRILHNEVIIVMGSATIPKSKVMVSLSLNKLAALTKLINDKINAKPCMLTSAVWDCSSLMSIAQSSRPSTPITSSSHVFTNPESTRPDFLHEICRFLSSVSNGFSFKN